MKITFAAIGFEQLAISQLSSIAKKKGHEVNLAFSASLFNDRYNLNINSIAEYFNDTEYTLETIKKTDPDVLAFSCLTSTYQTMLDFAKKAKKINPNIKTIFGGAHPSAVPERVLSNDCVDFVCIGEGDVAFGQLLDAIEKNDFSASISNIRFKNKSGEIIRGPQIGFIQNLDSLPYYDKKLWEDYIRVGDLYLTMTSRGCPYRCTFCFNNYFANLPECKEKGKYVRHRSVDHVMGELILAKKRYKLKTIGFEDDVFTVNKTWLKTFLDRYKKEINVPFQCLTHAQYLDDDIARMLSDSGCKFIQMGIQSMDEEYKLKVIKRPEKTANIEKALDIMRKYKIHAKVDQMFALPGEPEGALEKSRELYINHPASRIQIFWTNFLPGTELFTQAVDQKLITDHQAENILDGKDNEFFRSNQLNEDPQKIKKFKTYETIFKLLPIMPLSIRKRLSPDFFIKTPVFINSFISFTIDILSGFTSFNPAHIAYANHYLFHIKRFICIKFGFKIPKASKIIKQKDL